MRKSSVTKDKLLVAVKGAKSYGEILRNLGKSTSGNAVKLLKAQLEEFNIKVKLDYVKQHQADNLKKKPIEYYLVNESNCCSHDLKLRLIKEGLKDNKCECCGISTWLDKPISLQLHHINGNHKDNRLENLKILCPNCHTQTDTWGIKNK